MFVKSNDFVKFFVQMTIFAVMSLRQAQRPEVVAELVEVTAWAGISILAEDNPSEALPGTSRWSSAA